MPSVLFVCTANQIRSPIAAALFRDILNKTGQAQDWRVESAGTWTQTGLPASRVAQRVMRELNIDLSQHRTCCVTRDLLAAFDLILVMEHGHKEALRAEFPAIADRVYLLSEMASETGDVPDPRTGTVDDVRETVSTLQALLERASPRIAELAHSQATAHHGQS